MSPQRRPLTALMVVAALAAGCGTTPEPVFYTLATEAGAASSARTSAISVLVGPVRLPEAVERPQIVISTTGNRVEIEEFHRWTEPLSSLVPRVVAAQLGRQLGTPNTGISSDVAIADPDFRVFIDIQRFESRRGGDATVEALWTVRARGGKSVTGRTLARESAPGSFEALAAAHGRALATVSRGIAEAIESLRR